MLLPNTPVYLKDVVFTSETVDSELKRICRLKLRIAPFTAELAESLGADVRRHLFGRNDATAMEEIAEVKFRVPQSLQEMRLRFAVDASRDAIVIPDVRVDPLVRVRKDKETPTFEGNFSVDFCYPTAPDLLSLVANINNQLVATFVEQQGNLIDASSDKKKAKKVEKESSEPATAAATQ